MVTRSEADRQGTVVTEPGRGDTAPIEETSGPYVAQWNRLVSTTNWQKGRIICQWREALIEAGAPSASYSDEAWSRRVGGISPQHTGRLRKVYQRFAEVYRQYAGLSWSHFHAAVDWADAEMWLEGAVQSGWSVAQMRAHRRRVVGAPPQKGSGDQEAVAGKVDEEFLALGTEPLVKVLSDSLGVVQEAEPVASPAPEDPPRRADRSQAVEPPVRPGTLPPVEPFRPFENFAPLPPDLNRAFEAFRRAILRHKRAGWRKVALGDVLLVLDGLKQLALSAPERRA